MHSKNDLHNSSATSLFISWLNQRFHEVTSGSDWQALRIKRWMAIANPHGFAYLIIQQIFLKIHLLY